MPISDQMVLDAALVLADIAGFAMDPNDLLEDMYLLADAFSTEEEFAAAVAATQRAVRNLISRRVTSSALKYSLEGWFCFHYQHRVAQGHPANCRIVFRYTEQGIEVKIIGHRRVPTDIYERFAASRTS